MRIGYIRVSTIDQNTARQLEGVPVDKSFTDKISGKSTVGRVQLEQMMDFAREGDTVVVHSLDRLARNLDDLRKIVRTLTDNGVRVEFVKEGLTFTGDDEPMSHLLMSMLGAFAEFQRSLILEAQREGIAIAKQQGKYRGRQYKLSEDQARELVDRANRGENKSDLAAEYEISRQTVYDYKHRLAEES